MNLTIRLTLCALIVALAGCASHDRRLTSSSTRYLSSGGEVVTKPSNVGIADTVSYWDGDGVSGSPSITINLGEQKAFFYKDGRLVGVSMISSGREGYATPAGTYKVIRDPKPSGASFRGAPMPYFLRFHGGYGLHAGFLPGFPASHGCVRMPERMAEIFFANSSQGTPVRVVN